MKIRIIGSGGCVSTPRPCCNCRVCTEARKKGFPYARTGCSLYVEDIKLLIDTPEDINYALNNANVSEIESVLYSHADPDHTMGMRVFEQLRMDWLGCSVGKKNNNPIFDYADVLIIGNTIVGDVLKDGFVLEKDNPLREELFVMEEIEAIKEKYHIKNVVVTHLEEDWGKSFDDYVELEKQYNGIKFAYDGMEVIL